MTFVMTVFRHFRPRLQKVPRRTDEELARLTMPVQVVLGGKDPLLRSRETRARLERLLPQAQITYLEHAGHLLPSQSRAIVEFLGSLNHEDHKAHKEECSSSWTL